MPKKPAPLERFVIARQVRAGRNWMTTTIYDSEASAENRLIEHHRIIGGAPPITTCWLLYTERSWPPEPKKKLLLAGTAVSIKGGRTKKTRGMVTYDNGSSVYILFDDGSAGTYLREMVRERRRKRKCDCVCHAKRAATGRGPLACADCAEGNCAVAAPFQQKLDKRR